MLFFYVYFVIACSRKANVYVIFIDNKDSVFCTVYDDVVGDNDEKKSKKKIDGYFLFNGEEELEEDRWIGLLDC